MSGTAGAGRGGSDASALEKTRPEQGNDSFQHLKRHAVTPVLSE